MCSGGKKTCCQQVLSSNAPRSPPAHPGRVTCPSPVPWPLRRISHTPGPPDTPGRVGWRPAGARGHDLLALQEGLLAEIRQRRQTGCPGRGCGLGSIWALGGPQELPALDLRHHEPLTPRLLWAMEDGMVSGDFPKSKGHSGVLLTSTLGEMLFFLDAKSLCTGERA